LADLVVEAHDTHHPTAAFPSTNTASSAITPSWMRR